MFSCAEQGSRVEHVACVEHVPCVWIEHGMEWAGIFGTLSMWGGGFQPFEAAEFFYQSHYETGPMEVRVNFADFLSARYRWLASL